MSVFTNARGRQKTCLHRFHQVNLSGFVLDYFQCTFRWKSAHVKQDVSMLALFIVVSFRMQFVLIRLRRFWSARKQNILNQH